MGTSAMRLRRRTEDRGARRRHRFLGLIGPSVLAVALVLGAPAARGQAPSEGLTIGAPEDNISAPAQAGSRVKLEAEGGDGNTKFRWFQVEGPTVRLEDPTLPTIQVEVPGGGTRLGFVLVAARGTSVRIVRIMIPIRNADGSMPTQAPAAPKGPLKADAGDDQVGLVGHRLTLNGGKSEPNDPESARWVQVAGPAIEGPSQDGPFFSFVPTAAGQYKFVLLVSRGGTISEPDEVFVLVGAPPASAAPATAPAPAASTALSPPGPESMLRSVLPRMPEGARIASDVSDVMESIADRSSLYSSFASLQNELTRRLDVVVPDEPSLRDAWNRAVFLPLTAFTTVDLASCGIDPGQPRTLQPPLTPAQRERVREHFLRLAKAFRPEQEPAPKKD